MGHNLDWHCNRACCHPFPDLPVEAVGTSERTTPASGRRQSVRYTTATTTGKSISFRCDIPCTRPVKTERRLYTETTERLKQVVRALIQETPPKFRNPIPRGTSLTEAYIDSQKIAYLDFSRHLTDGHIGGTTAERLTVEAILKTVFDAFPAEIKQVQILIDGKAVETLAGHLHLSQPLRL